MKCLKVILGIIVIGIVGGIIFIYSGVYNVTAMEPHIGIVKWVLSTTSDNSVSHHAKDIINVPNLNDTALVKIGFMHYREMCAGCHGAPGQDRSEMGKGLYPKAPNLAHSAKEMSPKELFWVTKYGIKDTGMPAWGVTHPDNKIWAIVAFMKKLPDMSPQTYKQMNFAAGQNSDGD